MEDKNILPRLSRKMLESSFLSSFFLVLSLPALLDDDVLLEVVVVVADIVEKCNLGCELAILVRSLSFIDDTVLRRVVAEVVVVRERDGTSEVFMRLHTDCNNVD